MIVVLIGIMEKGKMGLMIGLEFVRQERNSHLSISLLVMLKIAQMVSARLYSMVIIPSLSSSTLQILAILFNLQKSWTKM